jgi:hypothetical protein
VLLFEFFPALVTVLSAAIATWLFFSNRNAPDESAQHERRERERRERAAAAKVKGGAGDVKPGRPSMRG